MTYKKYFIIQNYIKYTVSKFYNIRYKQNKTAILLTEYLGSKILVRANEDVGKSIMLGQFEKSELEFIKQQIPNDAVFFDIGSNIGLFSLVMANKSKKIAIHAFDPIKINTLLLQTSIELNEFKNICVNQSCVGNYTGVIEFSIASDSAYSSIHHSGRKTESEKITLPIITIDHYILNNKIDVIDFMKIDVEGAEKMVLEGMKNLLNNSKTRPKMLLIELFDENLNAFGTNIKEIIQIMAAHAYKPYVLNSNVLCDFSYEKHSNKIANIFFK